METSSGNNNPLVSVIITTFNRPQILKERALRSILNQTYRNIECIVVDDPGAKQSAEEAVHALAQNDKRLVYVKMQRSGRVNAARNVGIDMAQGEYICGLDDDDAWAPTFIEETVKAIKELPAEYGTIATGYIVIDEHGRRFYDHQPIDQYWALSMGCGYLFRRDVFFKSNIRYDESLLTYDDVDLSIQFWGKGYKVYLLDKPLRVYYLPAVEPKAGSGSLSAPSPQQAQSFEIYYKKAYETYRAMGPRQLAWLHLSGGLICCRGGLMKEGRRYIWRAFREQPSFYNLFYAIISLSNFSTFTFLFNLKSKIMRFSRAHFLNRILAEEALVEKA